ncbi:MAG: Ig-like domain-containing protein [Gemmatimonadales bacterium]|nr:Ig-like domain-containing protein [Gemmatimonadales bacterium]
MRNVLCGLVGLVGFWVAGCSDPVALDPASSVTDLLVVPSSATLEVGDTVRFSALAFSLTRPVSSPVTWISADPSVASVAGTGLVTAHGPGRTRITARAGGISRNADIWVRTPVTELVIGPDSIPLLVGWEGPVVVLTRAVGGDTLTPDDLTYTSTDPAIADVGADGIVRGRAAGRARILVSNGSLMGAATVVVEDRPIRLTVGTQSERAPGIRRVKTVRIERGVVTTERIHGDSLPLSSLDLLNAGLDWSPDGKTLVYSCGRDRACLWSEDSTGALSDEDGVYAPAWWDNRTIVYTRHSGAMKSGGPGPVLLPSEPGWYPAVSDGRLAYMCRAEDPFYPYSDSQLCLLEPDGSSRLVFDCARNPAWSPDGASLAFLCGYLYVHSIQTRAIRALRLPSSFPLAVCWTPDNRTVAVADYDGRLRLLDVVSGWSMAPIAAFGERIDALAWAP